MELLTLPLTLGLRDADGEIDILKLEDIEDDTLEDTLEDSEGLKDADGLTDGLADWLSDGLSDGLTLCDNEGLIELDGEILTDNEDERDGLILSLGLTL
jgi:hypothetical protein